MAKLKQNPEDLDTYWTLVRHYEYRANVKDLDALRLWFIEHQPDGKIWPGSINPQYDRAGYERGKALWLANLKRPGAAADNLPAGGGFPGRGRQAAGRVGPAERPKSISKRQPVGHGIRQALRAGAAWFGRTVDRVQRISGVERAGGAKPLRAIRPRAVGRVERRPRPGTDRPIPAHLGRPFHSSGERRGTGCDAVGAYVSGPGPVD